MIAMNKGKGKLVLPILALLVILSFISGCTPPPIQTSTDLNIEITELGFNPGIVYIPAGQKIKVTVTNSTDSQHSWVILREPYFSPYKSDTLDVFYEISVPSGESKTESFKSPETAIQLDIICENELCTEAGLHGKIIVVEELITGSDGSRE